MKRTRRPASSSQSELEELIDEAERLGALDDEALVATLEAAIAAPDDPVPIGFAREALGLYRIREAIDPDALRPYPARDTGLDVGDLALGAVHETELDWRIPLAHLPHPLVVGPTGQGKTNFVMNLLGQLHGRVPTLFVTAKTTEARLLIDPPIVDRAVHASELKLSLLEPPPGVAVQTWDRVVLETMASVWGLQYSRSLLFECVDEARRLYDSYSRKTGNTVHLPLAALYQILSRKRSKYKDGPDSALALLLRELGPVVDCSAGFPLRDILLNGTTLLMIGAIQSDYVARFIVDWLTRWLHQYFVTNGPNDGSVQHISLLDDAHRFLTKSAENGQLMPLSEAYLLMRQAGMRIGAVSQYPADLAPAIMSQSGVIVQVGGLVHERDVQAMGMALGLPREDWPRLQTPARGEFVARESLNRYARPFSGVTPQFPPPTRSFTEQDRQSLMQPVLHRLPFLPAIPLSKAEQIAGASGGAMPARMPGTASPNAFRLAHDILDHPWDLANIRFARLGLAGAPQQQAKNELLALKWVRQHKIVPGTGRPGFLLEPLAPLALALNRPLPKRGKGGYVHAFMGSAVAEYFIANGYSSVQPETFYGSKAVDVTAIDSHGHLHGVEITVSQSNLVDNLEKDFLVQPQFTELFVVCPTAAEVNQAKRTIASAAGLVAHRSRIVVLPIARFL